MANCDLYLVATVTVNNFNVFFTLRNILWELDYTFFLLLLLLSFLAKYFHYMIVSFFILQLTELSLFMRQLFGLMWFRANVLLKGLFTLLHIVSGGSFTILVVILLIFGAMRQRILWLMRCNVQMWRKWSGKGLTGKDISDLLLPESSLSLFKNELSVSFLEHVYCLSVPAAETVFYRFWIH